MFVIPTNICDKPDMKILIFVSWRGVGQIVNKIASFTFRKNILHYACNIRPRLWEKSEWIK